MNRLDREMDKRGMVQSRSQAENLIELGHVKVEGRVIRKPAYMVRPDDEITIATSQQYVSRAALKLASAAQKLKLDFSGKVVLDVGSSTGGFTQFALQRGADKVIAVDTGTHQLHPSLRDDARIDLHEKTDIRDLNPALTREVDVVVCDVSFISLREILPGVANLMAKNDVQIIAMVKPQFEAGSNQKHKGVIKNDTVRRQILKEFEDWARKSFVIVDKADSEVSGKKGNTERFYLLKPAR